MGLSSRARNVLFAGIATVLFLGLLELTLRLTLPLAARATLPDTMIRRHVKTGSYRYDPDVFWYHENRPNPLLDVNTYGFRRTRPMTVAKPPGTTRVFTFGDSQTQGAGVETHETYSAFAEEALGPDWEVINAGLSGYRSLNVYRLLQLQIGQFDPDIVVIDCAPFDSPRDNRPLRPRRAPTTRERVEAMLWRSGIFRALDLGIDKIRRVRRGEKLEDPNREAEGLGNHDLIAAWGRTHGVQVVFMEYAVQSNRNGVRCRTRVEDLPAGHPVVPTCSRLAAASTAQPRLFQDANHLTVEGNRVAGLALADTLRPLKR